VDAFALGFGPRILHWKSGEVEYSLRAIPFGGYVKIHGENPDEENTNGPDSHRSFVNKNRLIQSAVLVAGVFFNFLFAWLIYIGIFSSGVTASADIFEKYSNYVSDRRVMVTSIAVDSPAEKAGLQIGDNLLNSIEDVQKTITESNGKAISISYIRAGATSTTEIIPTKGIVGDTYAIGISMNEVGTLNLPFFNAVYESFFYTLRMIRDTALGLITFIATIFTGTANFSEVTGPIGIAGVVGDAAEMGITYLLMITAYISINLGVINLIPFPALDGGRLLFVIIEGAIRRRIPMKVANITNFVGFALLMLLMVVVTYRDIVNLLK
jgi:regulator of sigma E protease